MFRQAVLAVAVTGLALGSFAVQAPAQAAAATKAGVLTCDVASGWGIVFGSSRDLHCSFTHSGSGVTEHYTGQIMRFGVDIGYIKGGVIVWAVLAPTTNLGAGALSGDYAGPSAGASVAVGGTANVLVGGSSKEVSLQPISFEGDQGINVAAGIAAITLKLAP
jgi:hypothetical protein